MQRLDIGVSTVRIVKLVTLSLLVTVASALPALAQPRLILLTQSNLRNTDGSEVRVFPSYIKTKVSVIDSLPFDGVAFHSPSGSVLMNGTLHSTAKLANEWAPLKGVPWTRMKNNFAVVNVDRPADFFDDWSATIQSFQNLAVVLRDAGIQGILFDNEEYQRNLWLYPTNVSYSGIHPLSDYYAQARLRGGQIISAVQAVYPEIEFMVLLSPADNCLATPDLDNAWTRNPNNLASAFTTGLMENSTKPIVDGNEVSYNYRTQAEFDASYQWRRYGMATKCPFIPATLQASWSNRISISQSVYNRPIVYANGVNKEMSPAIMRQNLGMALRGVDKYAWLYWEGANWYNPVGTTNGVPRDWYDAVEQGWLATRSHPSPPTNLRIER